MNKEPTIESVEHFITVIGGLATEIQGDGWYTKKTYKEAIEYTNSFIGSIIKEEENRIIKKIATKEVHCELKGYKIGKKEMKKEILELIYGEIKKTTKDEKDTRSCECLENIYQKIKELKINSF